MEKVTVIIPCYNAVAYIERCIIALEKQSFQDFCVVLVDDCSVDHTYEVLCAIKNKSRLDITILKNDKNLGPAESRNKAIREVKTDYVTFCDADDWYEPEFLNEMYGMLEHYQADIAFCGCSVVNERGKKEHRPIIDSVAVLPPRNAFYYDVDSLCMLMVKTDIMKSCPLPEVRNGEDMAVVPLLIANSQKCILLSDCLYNYFRRAGSASQKPNMKVVDSVVEAFNYTYRRFPEGFRDELEYIGIKNLIYSALITLFSFSYDKIKADSIMDAFGVCFPSWKRNPHITSLTAYKRIVVALAQRRYYMPLKAIAIVRSLLNK